VNHRGFSLFELMFTLAIAVIIAFAGVPAMGRLVLDARLTADVNAFVTSIQLARSESAKRGASVVVCKTADGRTCGGKAVHYDAGWIVFVDEDGDDPPELDGSESVLWSYQPASEATIRSNRSRYVFNPYYRRSTNGTVTFCDRRGIAAARAVIVSYTGRPRASDRGPGGRRLKCVT
jgi:type IV fimbrial biogenesis protein FimT